MSYTISATLGGSVDVSEPVVGSHEAVQVARRLTEGGFQGVTIVHDDGGSYGLDQFERLVRARDVGDGPPRVDNCPS